MAHVNPFLSSNFFPLTSGTHKPCRGISQEGVVGQQQLAEQVKAVHIKPPEKGWRAGIGYLIFSPNFIHIANGWDRRIFEGLHQRLGGGDGEDLASHTHLPTHYHPYI